MNHSVHFTIPDHPSVAANKALAVVDELGAPLKSDSGHFVTGAIPYPGGSVDVHISWLPAGNGTQITVMASGEEKLGNGVFRVAERVQDTFLKQKTVRQTSRGGINLSAIMVVLSLFVVVGVFFFIMSRH